MKCRDLDRMPDIICEILWMIYVKSRKEFTGIVRHEGITREQFAAAAIAGMLYSEYGLGRNRKRRRTHRTVRNGHLRRRNMS